MAPHVPAVVPACVGVERPAREEHPSAGALAQLLSDDSVDGVVSISEPTFNPYVWRSDCIRRLQHPWPDEGVHPGYEIPEKEAFSVDDEYEFELIEALVRADFTDLRR